MIQFITWILLLFTTSLLVFILVSNTWKPPRFPPGPKWLPIVGNSPLIKHLSALNGGFHNALNYLSRKYKTNVLGLKLGADLYVVVFSKDLIRQVFTREEFQARPDNYFIRLRTMGSRKGITMTDSTFWQEQRNFAVRHLRSLGFGKTHMEMLIIEELQELVSTLMTGEDTIRLGDRLAPSVLNVLWALTAGSRFSPRDPQLGRLLELMAKRSRAFDMAGGVLSQFPILAHIAPEWSGFNIIQSLNKELRSLLENTIHEHKQTLDKSKIRDFIDAFLQEMDTSKNGHSFTEEQLVMVCLDFFIAGSQTTSNTLNFAFLNMILHQNVQDKVYKEIREVLGDRTIPSLEDKCRLPMVEAVLLESQRFLHVVPVAGPRRVLQDTTLDNYYIPKDTTVLLSLYSMHHDEDLWEQPMRFWPERFLDKKNNTLIDELYQFGLGKRRCLGENLAKNFIFLFFTGIMRNLHLNVPPGSDPPTLEPIPGITLSPKPYSVHISKRED